MKKLVIVCCVFSGLSAFADTKDVVAPMAMDMSKVGPATRKPVDEKKTKKEIDEMLKVATAADAAGDLNALVALHDFPVFMATDDAKGVTESQLYSKDEYVQMMKPMFEAMPKDMKTTHKQNVLVLSDAMAVVTDDFTMTTGKTKVTGRNASLLVKVGGQWKWKSMFEAGWGGMAPPPEAKTTAAAPAADKPAPAPAAVPAPAKK